MKVDYDEDPDYDYFSDHDVDEIDDVIDESELGNIVESLEEHNPLTLKNIGKCNWCKCDYNKISNETCVHCHLPLETINWHQIGGE
jgi:hypothetical protein